MDYLLLNQQHLAEQAIAKALALSPQDHRSLYLRGRLDFVTHDFSKAADDFRAVLETEPSDSDLDGSARMMDYLPDIASTRSENGQFALESHRPALSYIAGYGGDLRASRV